MGLKYFVQEYLFVLCDEEGNQKVTLSVSDIPTVETLTKITGFGNAAEFLVQKGLMKLGGGGN